MRLIDVVIFLIELVVAALIILFFCYIGSLVWGELTKAYPQINVIRK